MSPVRSLMIAVGLVGIISVPACGAAAAKPSASDPKSAGKGGGQASAPRLPTAQTRTPASAVSVMTETAPEALTAGFAKALFATSPVVVVAAKPSQGVQAAKAAHAPLLLASTITPQLASDIAALHPEAVLVEGLPASALEAKLRGVNVVTEAARLPKTGTPPRLTRVAVLIPGTTNPGTSTAGSNSTRGNSTAGSANAAIEAVTATAQAAGATVIPVSGGDPRTDPAAITTLARVQPGVTIAIGGEFGSGVRLKNRLAVAETGVQLPGGGQVMFPGRRLVALYGHPGAASLGALGQQGLSASVARARRTASQYKKISSVPVVPTFEMIATVAEGSAGPGGTYSAETPVSELRPWIDRATSHGMYVVLDLQPGRANLLAQAKVYQSLLEKPNVGLALDPEWKLQPGQLPLQQIGHVGIGEVNSVVHWLAALTAQHHLPQKLLVIHQFRSSMIVGEKSLDTSNDDLAILLHMDGQGSQGDKQSTWNSVTGGAPGGVWFGWKNFFVKDTPMLSPQQTMTKTPTPVMISYQ